MRQKDIETFLKVKNRIKIARTYQVIIAISFAIFLVLYLLLDVMNFIPYIISFFMFAEFTLLATVASQCKELLKILEFQISNDPKAIEFLSKTHA